MEIIHVSAECYPMAKVGGLADVVGALPRYQYLAGHVAKVVMPMHRTSFLFNNEWEVVHKGSFSMGESQYDYTIIKEKFNKLGFDLYCVDIFGLLDREQVYGYNDDTERFTSFQIAVTDWMSKWEQKPNIVHVHDHHAALIPFMMKNCFAYASLKNIPTILTIHNAQYQGWMGWEKAVYIPLWDSWQWGLLDWNNMVNPLACGIKCASRVTTVSEGYFRELMYKANGLESLIVTEQAKCIGLLNGIDAAVWNTETDKYIVDNYDELSVKEGKELNKIKLCVDFGFDVALPLIIFIGRLVADKGADLLSSSIVSSIEKLGKKMNFLLLGSGDPEILDMLQQLSVPENFQLAIGYNEKLSHQMYAGADFLLMPSRVEPCGLNQMYAMRYGTVPMTRNTGGLRDTVVDFEDEGGYGITFNEANTADIVHAIERAVGLFEKQEQLENIRKRMMKIDNSWEKRADNYTSLYKSVQTQKV